MVRLIKKEESKLKGYKIRIRKEKAIAKGFRGPEEMTLPSLHLTFRKHQRIILINNT